MSYDEFLRGAAMIAPARRAAFEVVRRVFEDDAYADRAFAAAVEGLDDRDRALAQRLAYGTVQRTRTIDFGIEQLGKRPVRKLDPPVRAALRLGALPARAGPTSPCTRSSTTRSSSCALRASSGRCRSRTPSCAGSRRASRGSSRRCPKGRSSTRIPTGSPRSWTRDFGAEEALELMRAQNEPPALEVRAAEPVGEPTDVPGAYVVERVDIDADAADEPRVAARGARRRLAGRRADSRRVRRAGRARR